MHVAKTILVQLGGRMFLSMTGSKNLIAGERSLTMRLTRNKVKATHLRITLNSEGVYDMEYQRVRSLDPERDVTVVARSENVQFDMLAENFERTTGLRTSFRRAHG